MATGPSERHRPDAAQIWMLQAERASLPIHNQIGARCRDFQRVVMARPLDVLDRILSVKWVPAILQYPHYFFASGFIVFYRDYSFTLPPLKVVPYSAVVE